MWKLVQRHGDWVARERERRRFRTLAEVSDRFRFESFVRSNNHRFGRDGGSRVEELLFDGSSTAHSIYLHRSYALR